MHATCICANSVTLHNQFRLVPLGDQSLPSFLHVNTMRTPVVRAQITEKPRNPYYEQDIGHVLKHPRWILRSIGIWPILLESDNRIFPRFLIGFSDLVLLFTVVPFSLYVTFEEKDITMKLKLLGLLTFCTLSLLKHWALAACMPRIKDCVENLENDWKEFAGGTSVDERNRTIKPLVYPTYSGMYNPQESPVYEMVYTVHCMCGYVIYSVTVGACGLAATFASHICGQIDVMILRLKNLVDLENKTERDQRLIQIVEHHIRTLRFSATVETLLQEVCFLEFVGSIFLICLLEYYILTDWGSNTWSFVTYFALLMSLMFNIFILCYIGDLLVEKTSDVGLSCFMTDWYKFPTDTIRALIMIIGMSSCPAKISAGQIVVLNLSTFGNILKTSLGYLSLLRTLV
ncbi:odorant receptor 4-like isoform X2 [Nomia melanderi]|uniref:odorant receptor 4-like isoform X2 n=1 Tax=Nomia melanderi TaxID=2448451 RepID=UPI003FCE1CC7